MFQRVLLLSLLSAGGMGILSLQPVAAETVTSTTPVLSTSETSGPLILQMGDGRFYNPQSGLTAPTKEELLTLLQAPTATSSTPVQATSTPVVVPNDFPLKLAIQRGRELLAEQIAQNQSTTTRIVTSDDIWREVTLAIWNKETDQLTTRRVLKKGKDLKWMDGQEGGLSVRVSNGVNSEFMVDREGKQIVVAVRYPLLKEIKIKGKKRFEVEEVVYTPYAKELHTAEMITRGKSVLDGFVNDIYGDLRQAGIRSRAFPDRLLADVVDPHLMKAIVEIEHLDQQALGRAPATALDTFFVTLAANEDKAYAYAKSGAGALGLAQFIPKTYESFSRRTDLGLVKDFESGMRDPRNAMKTEAAYLDQVLAEFPNSIQTMYDARPSQVNEYLAAAYNAGAVRVRRAVAAWGDTWAESAEKRLAALRDRHRELRLGMPVLKTKIQQTKDASTRKTLTAQLADWQKEYADNEDKQDLVNQVKLKRETIDYVLKYRQVIALGDTSIALAAKSVTGG